MLFIPSTDRTIFYAFFWKHPRIILSLSLSLFPRNLPFSLPLICQLRLFCLIFSFFAVVELHYISCKTVLYSNHNIVKCTKQTLKYLVYFWCSHLFALPRYWILLLRKIVECLSETSTHTTLMNHVCICANQDKKSPQKNRYWK